MAGPTVGDGVSQPLAEGTAGIVGGHLHAFDLHGELDPAVFLGQGFASLGHFGPEPPAMADIPQGLGHALGRAETQGTVHQAFFGGLHDPGDGSAGGNGVHAHLVADVIEFGDLIDIEDAEVGAQQPDRLELRCRGFPAVEHPFLTA